MIDIKTLVIVIFCIQVATSIIILLTWRRLKGRFNGLGLVLTDHVMRSAGLGLLLLRGIIPDFITIVIANTFAFGSFSFLLTGLQLIFGKKPSVRTSAVLFCSTLIGLIYFTNIFPSLNGRTVILYGINVVYCLLCYSLFAYRLSPEMRLTAQPLAVISLLIGIVSVARTVLAFIEHSDGDFFSIHTFGVTLLLLYSILVVLLTIGILFTLGLLLHDELRKNQINLAGMVKERTEQLLEAEKLATLGTLSAGVAHEINNPNNFILMNAQMLKKGCSAMLSLLLEAGSGKGIYIGNMPGEEYIRRLPQIITDIHDGSRRIERIVSDLKDYASASSRSKAVVNLNDVAAVSVRLIGATMRKHTNRFEFVIAKTPVNVLGDANRLEQAVTNILQNAINAICDKEQSVALTIGINEQKKCGFVEVRDQGYGISEGNLSNITTPFFTTRRALGGTGLGLWVVQHIVAEHSGRMHFESSAGKGTTVTIEIPVIQIEGK